MRMIRPKLDVKQVTIAENQHEYLPVTAAVVTNPSFPVDKEQGYNAIVMAFKPTIAELQRLVAGEAIYLSLLTFGGPMQPVILSVGEHETAAIYGVGVEQ